MDTPDKKQACITIPYSLETKNITEQEIAEIKENMQMDMQSKFDEAFKDYLAGLYHDKDDEFLNKKTKKRKRKNKKSKRKNEI